MNDWSDALGQTSETPTAPTAPTDDWSNALSPAKSNSTLTLDVNLQASPEPDRAAKVIDLHKRTGLPINLVDSQMELVEQEAKKRDFDTEKFAKENPIVSKWMSENPQQAALGSEDRAPLSATEKMLRFMVPIYGVKKAFEEDRVQPYIEQTGRSLGASVFRMGGATAGLFRAATESRYLPAEIVAYLSGLPPETGRQIFDIMEGGITKEISGFFGEQQQIAEDWAKYIRGDLSKFNPTEQAVFSGVESVGQNIVNLAAGIITKNPQIVLSLMSSQTAGEAYGQAREKGVSVGKSLIFGTAQGSVEYATELLPMMKLMKDLGLKTSFVRTLVNQAPSEIVGEQVATVLQDFNEWATLNPDTPFSNYADARGDAAYQTLVATITAMIGLTGAGQVVSNAVNYRKFRQQEDFFRALGDVTKDTKLRERLPDSYRALVDEITKDGPVENVYTPIEFFQSHFQTDQVDAREVAIELGIERAYDEAVAIGSKLAIPMSTYASKIAPTDHNTAFVKELAISADGLTSREAEELQKEFERTKEKEPDAFEQSAQKVRDDVQKQLSAIMPADQAETQATLWESRYRARAERLGMDPWTLYQQRPISFTRETDVSRGTRQNQPLTSNDIVLNQRGMEPAQRMAGDLAKGPAVTLTPNTVPGEGPYRVTHWLDGQPVRHEAFPDTTTAEKAFDRALTETNATAEKMGEKAITEQQTLFQQAKDQTESPEFKRWFGDSKVVDKNGNPLMVYHGTDADIEIFDPSFRGKITSLNRESYKVFSFSSKASVANKFATQAARINYNRSKPMEKKHYPGQEPASGYGGENIIPVYLALQNPLVLRWNKNNSVSSVIDRAMAEGYDGAIVKHVGNPQMGFPYADYYFAFNPEQIKSAIGNRGTFDPTSPNILYQGGIEEPRLSVLHNLSSENLEYADKMGGLAVPSLAVVKEGMGHEGFGDITLIGPRELADPKQVDVHDADAYTSTFPRPEYRKVKSSVAQKFVDALRSWTNLFEESGVFQGAWDNAVNRPNPEDTIISFSRSNAVKAWFLHENGIEIKPALERAERAFSWASDPEFKKTLSDLTEALEADRDSDTNPAYMKLADAARSAIDRYMAAHPKEVKALREIYPESTDETIRGHYGRTFGISGEWVYKNEPISFRLYDKIRDDLRNEGKKNVNRSATDKKINKALQGKEEEFKQWTENKVLPMYGEPFLTLGKKKVEYNLDNIVAVMTRGGTKAKEKTITFNEGIARATAAVKISDFQEMRNRAHQIVERGKVDEIREKAKKAMSDWRNEVVSFYGEKDYRGNVDVWGGLNASMRAIAKWAKGRGLAEALRSEGFKNVPKHILEQGLEAGRLFLNAPVPFFEAKPERVVKLDEFAGAVIPADASENVKAILDKHKIPYQTYPKRFDEASRTAVVDKFRNELAAKGENVLFQKERGATRFTDRTVNIGLFKNADLSTLLHESGHVFLLDMHGDVQYLRGLKELNAKQQGVIDDFNNLLKWLGITEQELLEQTTVDGKTTLSPKSVKANEQFARGMEAYFAEGKAPSPELRSAFQRFKAWMVHVYRLWRKDAKINRELNVHLNDEVRGILDRLLATDEQIRQAQEEADVRPVFTDAVEAGMSDTEFAAYRKTLEDANAEAHEELEQKLMREFQRERSKWWKEERAKARADIEADVDQRPIYKALAELKREGGIRLDRKAVAERFKDRLKLLPVGVAAKEGGIDPDTAAQMLGFKSGEELINRLSTMQSRNKVIESETDAKMTQEHGNMLMDGTMYEKAREAVRGELRSQVILKELKALQKKAREAKPMVQAERKEAKEKKTAGRQIYLAAIPTVQQARETAERTIAGTRIRDIRPMQYFAAARKASKAAIEAVNKGDFILAAVNKRQEMIANEMFRAATKAQVEVKKITDYLNKFEKKTTRERIAKAGEDFLDQIDALLARYNLHPQSEAVLKKKKATLQDWYQAQVDLGFEPTIDPDLMDEARRVNYKDAPLEDLQALQDAVKSIEYVASRIGKMNTIMGEMEFDEVVSSLVGRAEEALSKIPKEKEQILKSWLDRKKDMLKGHDTDLVSVETLVELLDGGAVGPWHDYIFNVASESQSNEYDMAAEVGDKIGKIIDEYVEKDTGRLLDMFQTTLDPEPMSRYKLISIAFNIGNESNMEKMAKGHNWTEAQILEAVKMLDPKDLYFVQKVWDTLETLYPKLNELQKKVSGVSLTQVPSRAVHLTLNNGAKIDLRGGYYPVYYDPDLTTQGQKQDTGPLAGLTERGYARATAPDSFRKTRTKFAAPMRYDFGYVLQKHLSGVMKDLSHREFLIDMNRLLRDKRIRKVLQERLGKDYERMFMPWLKGIANDRNVSPADLTGWDKRFEAARSHVTVVALGFKVTSMLAQVAGISNSLEYISDNYGSRYLVSSTMDFVKSPFHTFEMVKQKSGEMRHRFETIDREVRDELRRLSSVHPIRGLSKAMLAKEMFERGAFYGINFMDRLVAIPTWMAAYQGALDQMIKEHPTMMASEMERKAVHAGDAAVRRTQGAGGAKDLSAIQRKRGVMKILTMFYTPFAAWYGRMRTVGAKLARADSRWKYTPEAVVHVALITMIPTIMAELLAGRGPDECEKKKGGDYAQCFGRWAAIKSVFSLAAPIPVIRDVANTLESVAIDGRPRDTRFSPVLDAINRVAKTGERAGSVIFGDKKLEDDLVFDIFETSGYFMGFPTGQPRITLEYLYDLMTDEAEAETPMEFMAGLAYRRKPDRTR